MTAPEADAYSPNWYLATTPAAAERRALAADLDVDVCVIGAGLVGLTIARELARRGRSVAVLEARRIASHASGRHAGVVAPGFSEPIEFIIARVGIESAKTLWELSAAGVARIRQSIAETAMPGINPIPGKLVVRTIKDTSDSFTACAALLQQEFATAAAIWPPEQVHTVLRSPRYFEALHLPDAFHVHPRDYAFGLAGAAEKAGVRIFEETRAVAIDSDGVRKRVVTATARVRAAQVVLATGGEGGTLHSRLAGTVMTLARPMALTQPLEGRLDAVSFAGLVQHAPFLSARYHLAADRLLWAGPLTTAAGSPQHIAGQMRRQIMRFYPQLHDMSVTEAWSAPMAYTVHGMPQIGELAPGVWVAEAFADNGINVTAMAGDLIASAIAEGDDRWRLFTPYGLVWTGGALGRAVTTVALTAIRAKARLRESLSRNDLPTMGKEVPAAPEAAINAEAAQPLPTPAMPEAPQEICGVGAVAPEAIAEVAMPAEGTADPTKPVNKKKRTGSRRKATATPLAPNGLEPSTAEKAPGQTRASGQPGGAAVRRSRARKAKAPQAAPPSQPVARAEDPVGTDV